MKEFIVEVEGKTDTLTRLLGRSVAEANLREEANNLKFVM